MYGRLASAVAFVMLVSVSAPTQPIPVRYREGLVHGFLTLRTTDGALVANGDLIQVARGDRVTSRLVFHFKDGSLRDESSVFSQRQSFRLISNHLVQKGPTFPQPLDLRIDCSSGQVTVRYTDDHGKQKVESERMKLPPDLANGMTLTLLKNVRANSAPPAMSMVVTTPKPRLVKLVTASAGEDPLSTGSLSRRADHYVVKIEIGGLAGLLAPLVGKQPPATHIWILGGEAPAFVKSEGAMFLGGPIWRIELVSPVWPTATRSSESSGR
ncbi:MAG: hypothetical protein ACRD2I_17095 [Vicinamibacterales bacterium]